MGNWTLLIEGTGCHHNGKEEIDADLLAPKLVQQLRDQGQTIEHATFTAGGRQTAVPGPTKVEQLTDVLRRNGFRECDIPVCNCGSWHHVGGFAERFREIDEATADDERNGETLLTRIGRIVADRERLRAALASIAHNDHPSDVGYARAILDGASDVAPAERRVRDARDVGTDVYGRLIAAQRDGEIPMSGQDSLPSNDAQRLMAFYDGDNITDLIRRQSEHIARLLAEIKRLQAALTDIAEPKGMDNESENALRGHIARRALEGAASAAPAERKP